MSCPSGGKQTAVRAWATGPSGALDGLDCSELAGFGFGGLQTSNSLGLRPVVTSWRGNEAALVAALSAALSAGLTPALSTGRFAFGGGKGSNSVSALEDTTSMLH